jgi:hypothetical protein
LRVAGHSELERLLDAGEITRDQYDVGQRLAELRHTSCADWHGVSWSESGCGGSWNGGRLERMDGYQEGAWRRYHALLQALPAPCRREVEWVAVRDRSALNLGVLRDGLELLAKAFHRSTQPAGSVLPE